MVYPRKASGWKYRFESPMKRYPGLDFLRAIAILWVLLFHARTEGLGSPFPAVGKLGWMGVDLFFVLSGYLIGSQLLKVCSTGQTPAIGSFGMAPIPRSSGVSEQG